MAQQRRSPFYFARWEAGYLDLTAAAELFGVTPRTIRTWDKQGAPLSAMRLLFALRGDLGAIHPAWKGFRITEGVLIGPNRLRLSVDHIRAWPQMVSRYGAMEAELWRLRRSWWYAAKRHLRRWLND